jgi:type I restriction enzyme S subunit
MTNERTEMQFAELLTRVDREVRLIPESSYRSVGVKWYGQGVYVFEEKLGSAFQAARFEIRSGDVVYNDMWARRGSAAIVPKELDGCVCSAHFPTFEIRTEKILPAFLHHYFHTPKFWEKCEDLATGSTGRNAVTPKRFLSITIPLPPLPEQKRIVAWLDGLATRVSAAKALWSERTEDYRQLTRGLLFTHESRSQPTPFSELLTRRPLDVDVEPDGEYPFGGVYSFGRGMFRREPKRGSEFAYQQLTRVHAGEFCYPKLMAWEGAFAVVPPECDGCVVSPEFPVFTINTQLILPEVLEAYFRLPETWQTLAGSSTGTNLRRRRLNPTTLLAADMPLPSMARQVQFRRVTEKLRAIEKELTALETDLAALLPSALAQVFGG